MKSRDATARECAVTVKDCSSEFSEQPAAVMDTEQVFMLYANFCGDVDRTAYAAGVSRDQVIELASKHGWNERVRGLIELKGSEKAGDVERGINRAMNFVQANRYRIFLERVLRKLTALPEEELLTLLVSERLNKEGVVTGRMITTRCFADLASALEKTHAMIYMALNDSAPERARRVHVEEPALSVTDIHARIAKTMADMRAEAVSKQAQEDQGKYLAAGTQPATPGES